MSMTFTIDGLFAAAEQELAACKGEGDKLRTDFDYEKLGFLRAVAERLQSVSQNSGKPLVSGSLPYYQNWALNCISDIVQKFGHNEDIMAGFVNACLCRKEQEWLDKHIGNDR